MESSFEFTGSRLWLSCEGPWNLTYKSAQTPLGFLRPNQCSEWLREHGIIDSPCSRDQANDAFCLQFEPSDQIQSIGYCYLAVMFGRSVYLYLASGGGTVFFGRAI